MSNQEISLPKIFLTEPQMSLGSENLAKNSVDPRFRINDEGTVRVNLDFYLEEYGLFVMQQVRTGFEFAYQKKLLAMIAAKFPETDTSQDALYQEINQQLVRINELLQESHGIDFIGTLNDQERLQEEILTEFRHDRKHD